MSPKPPTRVFYSLLGRILICLSDRHRRLSVPQMEFLISPPPANLLQSQPRPSQLIASPSFHELLSKAWRHAWTLWLLHCTTNLSGNTTELALRIDPKCHHFSPPPLLPLRSLSSPAWVTAIASQQGPFSLWPLQRAVPSAGVAYSSDISTAVPFISLLFLCPDATFSVRLSRTTLVKTVTSPLLYPQVALPLPFTWLCAF